MRINEKMIEAAVVGGSVLGGGGGGWIEEGLRLGRLAFESGFREIRPIKELPDEAMLLTVSAVGAPSAGSDILAPEDYVRAVELFLEKTGVKVTGLVSSEVGALGVVNGWIQSAALQIPVIDAPANGRAHPLGLMGSMGLHRRVDFVSRQTAVGGSLKTGNRVEAFFEGPLVEVSDKVREAALKAGGMVAVARNPVQAGYVRENGAPDAIRMAVRLGNILLRNKHSGSKITFKEIYNFLGVDFIVRGKIDRITLRTEGGLDVGAIHLRTRNFGYELTFWNEYMTFERDGMRLATFPDLMMTFDSRTATPLISAEIREGQEVVVIAVLKEQLILGAGMSDDSLLGLIERAIGKEIVRYRR
ncbi:MAG: DUF917 family protein [Acidobacteriota bacterium]